MAQLLTNSSKSPRLQWFPGHMKKARDLVTTNLRLVDVVVELLDARIPLASANPMLASILQGKPKVIALNKADLADRETTRLWIQYFQAQGTPAVKMNSVTGAGKRELLRQIQSLAKEKTERLAKKGAMPRKARVMVVGIPNVGKSSLINRLAGGVKAQAANRPGVTRAQQWVRIGDNVDLLDMPGILWPKFEDPAVGLKLAFIGAIKDDVFDVQQVTRLLLQILCTHYASRLADRFKLTEDLPTDIEKLLEQIGRKRGCLLKGGLVDMEKTEGILLTEFRAGKFGTISLERPEDFSTGNK